MLTFAMPYKRSLATIKHVLALLNLTQDWDAPVGEYKNPISIIEFDMIPYIITYLCDNPSEITYNIAYTLLKRITIPLPNNPCKCYKAVYNYDNFVNVYLQVSSAETLLHPCIFELIYEISHMYADRAIMYKWIKTLVDSKKYDVVQQILEKWVHDYHPLENTSLYMEVLLIFQYDTVFTDRLYQIYAHDCKGILSSTLSCYDEIPVFETFGKFVSLMPKKWIEIFERSESIDIIQTLVCGYACNGQVYHARKLLSNFYANCTSHTTIKKIEEEILNMFLTWGEGRYDIIPLDVSFTNPYITAIQCLYNGSLEEFERLWFAEYYDNDSDFFPIFYSIEIVCKFNLPNNLSERMIRDCILNGGIMAYSIRVNIDILRRPHMQMILDICDDLGKIRKLSDNNPEENAWDMCMMNNRTDLLCCFAYKTSLRKLVLESPIYSRLKLINAPIITEFDTLVSIIECTDVAKNEYTMNVANALNDISNLPEALTKYIVERYICGAEFTCKMRWHYPSLSFIM